MKVWEVNYIHMAEFKIRSVVEAETEAEAISKARIGDYIEEDDLDGPEWIETKDYRAKIIEEIDNEEI